MRKFLVLAISMTLPTILLTGVADAAPQRIGSFSVNVEQSEFPITYPGAGNEDVKNVSLNVTSSGLKSTDKLRVGFDCVSNGTSVYKDVRTIHPNNASVVGYPISFYISSGITWRGEHAICSASLYWESWNRKTLYSFGGTLQPESIMFEIGLQ